LRSVRARIRAGTGLSYERLGSICTLELDRPAVANRVDLGLAQAICAAVEEIEHDDAIHVVVLRAAGRYFCSGVEGDGGRVAWVEAIASLSCPVLAVVQGDALAEGFELALACDLRLVSSRARFALPQIAAGRLPGHGGTQRLPRLIGSARALDLLLSGRPVGGAEALAIGLAQRVVPPSRLAAAATRMARDLASKGPIALRYAKEAVWKGADMTLAQGIRLEEDLYALLQTSADRREGVDAFRTRRSPRFRGR